MKPVFIHVAKGMGLSQDEADSLFNLLPKSLQEAPAFYDQMTQLWRYDFGFPIDNLPTRHVVIGTQKFHQVNRLVRVLCTAFKRISKEKLPLYLSRLSDAGKHQDVLAEVWPILEIDPNTECEFEVSGHAAGNQTIDWLIHSSTSPVLLDVKYRMRDLIEGLAHIASTGEVPPPTHDIKILFRNTEEKFMSRDPKEVLQGVWIISELKQERTALGAIFESLDPTKLHFVVIANWQKDAYVLVRNNIQRESITSLFNVIHSDRFVFDQEM